MGPFPRALMVACPTVLRWLLMITAGLLLILIVVQYLRGDEGAAPVPLLAMAALMAAGAWVCAKAAAWFGTP